MFMCGLFGCHYIALNEKAHRFADEKRIHWAHSHRRLTGHFPPLIEQQKVYQEWYDRIANIQLKEQK